MWVYNYYLQHVNLRKLTSAVWNNSTWISRSFKYKTFNQLAPRIRAQTFIIPLGRDDSSHILISYFFITLFKIVSYSCQNSHFPTEILLTFYPKVHLSHECFLPFSCFSPRSDHPKYIWLRTLIRNLLLMHFSPVSYENFYVLVKIFF
jgi:hypothetical protein